MQGGPAADRIEVLDSVEIAIVGAVVSYVGGTNANWVEDENIDRVQREQVARAIHAFAGALGDPEQTVFKDHLLGGSRVADVASKVSRSPRSVERTLRELREQLRTHLPRDVLS